MFWLMREHIDHRGPQKGHASCLLGQMFRWDEKIRRETTASISAVPGDRAVPAGETLMIQPTPTCASLPTTTTRTARLVAWRNPPWRVERTARARPCSRLPNARRPPTTASVLTGAERIGLGIATVAGKHRMANAHHHHHRHHHQP